MPIRTTILKSEAGVIMSRVETLTTDNMVMTAYLKFTTLRHEEVRVFTDIKRATAAYKAEVAAAYIEAAL